ncbi:hypothetical protein ABFX02_08G180000 [Erythranthe guttata]
MEEEELLKVLKEAKLKLEEKYSVRISFCALLLAIHSLQFFDSISTKLISEEAATSEKCLEILDGACKLVVSKFRNCTKRHTNYGEPLSNGVGKVIRRKKIIVGGSSDVGT